MDISEKDQFGMEKRSGDHLNYHTSNLSSDWGFGGGNLNPSVGLVLSDHSIPVCKGDPMGTSSCSSVSMVDSFCPNLWDHPNSQDLGLDGGSVQTSTSTSNVAAIRKAVPGSSRSGLEKPLDVGWNPPNSSAKGGMFLQTGSGILPQSFSQFPADSAFIERAARFSCFSGRNFSDMMNSFGISESLHPYSKGGGIQGPEGMSVNNMKAVSRGQSQENELHLAETSKDVSLLVDHGSNEGSLKKNEIEAGNLPRPSDEGKQGIGMSNNESDEAEFSGGGQDETSNMENAGGESSKGVGAKKRKRNSQDADLEQVNIEPRLSAGTSKEIVETKQKAEQNPSLAFKNTGKLVKESSQNTDTTKEDFIHVRARRGQATNSHSLAERVRREKISERMRFLQDLVPGCSKVTGKAVMLDEIINYVQSLQRQVEFLSMKLAAVNPRLDFNIEGLLSKDILQSRGGPSSTIGFSPDMGISHPQLHPSQHGLIPPGIPGIGNPSDVLRRTINSQLTAMNGYREPTPQIPNAWDDELNSVVQMSFGANVPFNPQELNGPLPPGHMKVEL